MTVATILTAFGRQHIDGTNAWYSWRRVNPEKLPPGVSLSAGNEYEQNADLKHQLHMLWANADAKKRRDLTDYYVAIWGGIRSNRTSTMASYATETPEQLIGRGVCGVASWSKVLCMHDPNSYAIYDARVAVALNVLLLRNSQNVKQFPLVSSRNVAVAKGIDRLEALRRSQKWPLVPEKSFYSEYLTAARAVAKNLGAPLCAIEMLLFSKALELAAELESN